MSRAFEITEPASNLRTLLLLFTVVPTVLILAVLYLFVVPTLPPLVLLAVLPLVLVQNIVLSRLIERRNVAFDGGMLEVQAGMSNQRMSVAEIDLDHARVLRLDDHQEWRPFMRTGGLGMPGVSLGWFRTRNLTRIFCLLTDRQRVLLLPLRGKKEAVLLSLKRPDELLSAMRGVNDAGSRGRQ